MKTNNIDKIKTQMESATLCATCALRETCDKSATRNHWRSLNQTCNEWRAWNGKSTIYDAFEVDCERFNVNFLILEGDVEQDNRDRARNSSCKSLEDLRRLMGTEIEAKVTDE